MRSAACHCRRLASVLLIAALWPVALAAQPSDSESAKYSKRPAAPEKQDAPKEPDPRQHECPWLDHIFDDTGKPNINENREEVYAFNYLIDKARQFSPDAFARHARKELTFRRLFEEGHLYRGEIVHVQGRLKLVEKLDSGATLKNAGIPHFYECWIFSEQAGLNPTCVIMSELPPGIEPIGELDKSVTVATDGYYFKRYVYRARNDTRRAPLIIARTMQITDPPAESPGARAFGRLFLPVVFTLLLGMVALAFGLQRWFRYGDRRAHAVLANARPAEFIAPVEEPPSPAPRVMPDGPSWN